MTKIQCRYVRLNDERCTAEVVDPRGPILLCSKHLGRAVDMFEAKLREALKDTR